MEKPQPKRKTNNFLATLGSTLMMAFLAWSIYWDVMDLSGQIPTATLSFNHAMGVLLMEVLLLLLAARVFFISIKNPLVYDRHLPFMILVASLFFVYYLYFVGVKLALMVPGVKFGLFAISMYGIIVPIILLWSDVFSSKRRLDDYFAYLYYLKLLREYDEFRRISLATGSTQNGESADEY